MSNSLPREYERRNVGKVELVAHVRVVEELAEHIRSSGSLYEWAAEQPQPRALRGRAPVYVASLSSGESIAVRHVWHGGLLAPCTGDRFRKPTRAATELVKSLYLTKHDVPTAPVLGYALYPAGLGLVRVDVVTSFIDNAWDFDAVLSGLAPGFDKGQSVVAVRELLGKLRDNRLIHRDLNIKNILLQNRSSRPPLAYVIDVDTMEVRANYDAMSVHKANAERLMRSLDKWKRNFDSDTGVTESITDFRLDTTDGMNGISNGTSAPQRFCIVMMSAVGDAVHVMPLVHAIKEHNPNSHITWVLQPGPATLVQGHPLVDEIVIFDRRNKWKAFERVRDDLKKRHFDVVLALQVYFKAGLVTSFTNAPIKLGFDRKRARDANWLFTTHRIPARPAQHVQDQYFEFLDALGISHSEARWTLGPWNHDELAWQRSFVRQFERPIASIVVATSKAQKDWLPERWAEVCSRLYNDYGLQPVLTGGTSERERKAESVILERAPFAHSALGSGLRKLAGILDASALVLSPDTGPLHLSVALRAPVISLFGYTNPKRVGPYDFSRDLMIDAYGDPGEDYPLDMTYRLDRMQRISVDDIMSKVDHWSRAYMESRLASLRERGLLPG